MLVDEFTVAPEKARVGARLVLNVVVLTMLVTTVPIAKVPVPEDLVRTEPCIKPSVLAQVKVLEFELTLVSVTPAIFA
jgi:hypothetical protein